MKFFARQRVREVALTPRYSPWVWLVVLPFLVALPGCGEDFYSESMFYPVRSDPILRLPLPVNKDPAHPDYAPLGSRELLEPDRPGQLPLFNVKQMEDQRNPFFEDYRKGKNWFIDPASLGDERQELQEVLEGYFGTPAHPKVGHPKSNVQLMPRETRQILGLDEITLKEGSRLYRQYCLQCHGLTGDGRGPTAMWVNPHPRDYRPGVFKFQSVKQTGEIKTRPPSRDDLFRTIYEGVEGTAMQSYNMLPEQEIHAIISYVMHLSIRGEVEEAVFKAGFNDDKMELSTKGLKGGLDGFIKNKVRLVVGKWRGSQDESEKIVPGPYTIAESDPKQQQLTDSAQRGYDIFVGRGPKQGGCTQCHVDFGRQAMFKFDDWGTLVRPRDLTRTTYRGGRRPIDLYYRIHSGINGANMPAQGANLTSDEIWDLVNFVRVLPYPAMRKALKPAIE